jgi:MoaA/NifB/PqqE/SkfB family radical SAM enzyme
VVLNVTGRCGGTCEYCGSRESIEEEMTTGQIFSIIDDLSEMGCGAIALTGGDPLMRGDIGEIIDYTKLKGLKTCVCSDGSNVKEQREIIRRSDYLQLSFDGPSEIHDRLKYPGAYNKFFKARETAIEDKIKFFTLTVITKLNIEYLDYILDEAKKYRSYAFFQPLSRTYFYDDVTPPGLKYTTEELEGAVRKLIKAKQGIYRRYIGDSVTVLNHFINPAKGYKCYAGRFFAYIHFNGDVYPCWTPPKMDTLNCVKTGFRKAFEGIPEFKCDSCRVSSLVQMNYTASLDIDTFRSSLSRSLFKRHSF